MAWTNSVNEEVAGSYTFGGYDQWGGFFGDALGAWVTVEGLKAKESSSAAAQEATRSATTQATGTPVDYPDTGRRAGGGGINPQTALVGGVLLLGLVLMLK